MKKLIELRQLKAAKVSEMRSIIEKAEQEKRSITPEEQNQFNSIKTKVDELNIEIENHELLANEERNLAGQNQPVSHKLNNGELRNYILTGDTRSLSTSVTSDGGYTVIPDLNKNVMQSLTEQSPMRQICHVSSTASNTFEQLISLGGAKIERGVEGTARDSTDTPTMAKISIKLNNIYAYPRTTQEILDFSDINILDWLTTEVSDTFVQTEDDDLINGDGKDKAKGLLSYPTSTENDANRPFGTIQKITVSEIKADYLIDLLYKLHSRYRKNTTWVMNSQTAATLQKLKNNNGDYIWRDRLQVDSPDMLLGRPVQYVETMPDTGLVIAVGDFKRAYYIIDHTTGIRTKPDNITEPGFYKVHTDKYLGGGLVDSKAVKFLELSKSK